MRNIRRILSLALCGVTGTIFADDFKSVVIPGDGGATLHHLTRVHGDQFLLIRNFTQEGNAGTRGVVTVTPRGNLATNVNVLTAAILNTSATPPPEVINSVVIAGPADTSVTCGAPMGSNCFISYKKDSN